tara:strand:- start:2840 stop:3241 length:402 start_codon:yes stop_codon:yes gene_type:complete
MKFSDIELPSNYKFGFFFTALFILVGAYFINKASITIAYTFLALAAVFLIVTIIKAELLLPLNKLWMRFGLLLSIIVSPIVLGIIFFGLFTPMSLLMKIFGRDELRLKLSNRKSHWKIRRKDNLQMNTFKDQF